MSIQTNHPGQSRVVSCLMNRGNSVCAVASGPCQESNFDVLIRSIVDIQNLLLSGWLKDLFSHANTFSMTTRF